MIKTSLGQVFIPKQFTSAREAFCVRCSIKANEGLLYPLAKSFIFIHKPTIIIKFEDILQVEFRRYEGVANAGKNFFRAIGFALLPLFLIHVCF